MSDENVPETENVDLPDEAKNDTDDRPYIVNHAGERVLLSEYRESDEFRNGYVAE